MARASFNISLPLEMAREVAGAMKREHRTRSELVREALRVYFAMTTISEVTPSAAERRAIARGRAELRRGEAVTLDELRAAVGRIDEPVRRQSDRARSKSRPPATPRRARKSRR
jgi:predicted transcriptional regulator